MSFGILAASQNVCASIGVSRRVVMRPRLGCGHASSGEWQRNRPRHRRLLGHRRGARAGSSPGGVATWCWSRGGPTSCRPSPRSLGRPPTCWPPTSPSADERAALPGRVAELGLVVDVLVNNAGLSTSGPVAASDPAAELNLVEVDVAAVADLCSRFVPGMVARGRGAVLNVASVGAFGPVPGQAAYGAAKAFVLSYTQALGQELNGHRRRRVDPVPWPGQDRIR